MLKFLHIYASRFTAVLEHKLTKKTGIKLSPINRLTNSFDLEMNLDKVGLFNIDTYDSFIKMYHNSEVRRDKIVRSVLIFDALAFLVLNGGNLMVPGLGLELAKIPAVLEILVFTSSISFFFFCVAFVNTQCYAGIVDQIGIRLSSHQNIDPDFINASKKHYDFFLKVFRPKLNIWGVDFFESRKPFAAFSVLLYSTVLLVLMALPLTHLWVLTEAVVIVLSAEWSFYFKLIFAVSVGIINMTGVIMVFGITKVFTFDRIQSQPQPLPVDLANKTPKESQKNT